MCKQSYLDRFISQVVPKSEFHIFLIDKFSDLKNFNRGKETKIYVHR